MSALRHACPLPSVLCPLSSAAGTSAWHLSPFPPVALNGMQTEQDNPLIDAIFDNAPEREGVHNYVPKGVAIDLKVITFPI